MQLPGLPQSVGLDQDAAVLQLLVDALKVVCVQHVRVRVDNGHQQRPVAQKHPGQLVKHVALGQQDAWRPKARQVVVEEFQPEVGIVTGAVELTKERNRQDTRKGAGQRSGGYQAPGTDGK